MKKTMKVVLLLIVALMLGGCPDGGLSGLSSGAISSCGECASDLYELQTGMDKQAATDRMFEVYGLQAPEHK